MSLQLSSMEVEDPELRDSPPACILSRELVLGTSVSETKDRERTFAC